MFIKAVKYLNVGISYKLFLLHKEILFFYSVFLLFLYIADTFKKISTIHTNIDEDGDSLRNEFMNYLTQLMAAMTDKREQEELSIMNNR